MPHLYHILQLSFCLNPEAHVLFDFVCGILIALGTSGEFGTPNSWTDVARKGLQSRKHSYTKPWAQNSFWLQNGGMPAALWTVVD